MYYILFISLSDDENLGCFYLLATLNNSAIGIQMFGELLLSVFWDTCAGAELFDRMAVRLILGGAAALSFTAAARFCILNSRRQESPFLCILT